MPRNPLRRKNRIEQARDEVRRTVEQARDAATQARKAADDAAKQARKAADDAGKQARKAADDAGKQARDAADEAAEPVPEEARRPLAVALVIGAVVVVVVLARKLRSGGAGDVPQPGAVRPTAPHGPSDPGLNDPALKAKVESELFADESVPKDRVSVGVSDGVVTLRGKLDSPEQTTTVSSAAENVEGVRRVENLMTFD